jgi:hypothetical protein
MDRPSWVHVAVKRGTLLRKEVIHQIIPHITCLFNRKRQTILEFADACINEIVSITGDIHNRDIA